MFSQTKKLAVKFDYVTCHNIKTKAQNPTLSKTQTATHIYPIFHTNPQIWWSSVQQSFATSRKVMWTRSGYTKPFYDDGVYGTTDMGYYVEVQSKQEGLDLVNNLNSSLFAYILKTARWSGFGNELVFGTLPELPKISMTDAQMYAHFNLTQSEIDYIENFKTPSTKQKATQTIATNINRSQGRVNQTAEVFTCDELANRLVEEFDDVDFLSKTNRILEPSAGNGQLVLAALRNMKKLGRTDWQHIIENQLYICEYMKDNVEELLDRLDEFTGLNVRSLNHNIIWADFLSFTTRPFLLNEWNSNKYNSSQIDRL
jgi:hypothetical protein